MKATNIDLVLHPVRMRIVMAVATKPMTAGQIAAVLKDVAQATLYRHIKLLSNANVLQVVEERPMRGTVEKVYALNQRETYLSPDDAATMPREQLLHAFTMFATSLIGDFGRYLQQEGINPSEEISFNKVPIYLSDEELIAISKTINEALLPHINNPQGLGRRRHILASILIPDVDDPQNTAE